jgi:hypothetical protein
MNDIEQKAMKLMNEICEERGYAHYSRFYRTHDIADEALCRAIEQHEAFRQEVSDALLRYFAPSHVPRGLKGFIIPKPKPDPLVGACNALNWDFSVAEELRTILDVLGFEIREKNDER